MGFGSTYLEEFFYPNFKYYQIYKHKIVYNIPYIFNTKI